MVYIIVKEDKAMYTLRQALRIVRNIVELLTIIAFIVGIAILSH